MPARSLQLTNHAMPCPSPMDTHNQADGTITPPHRGPGLALNWFLEKVRSFEDGL